MLRFGLRFARTNILTGEANASPLVDHRVQPAVRQLGVASVYVVLGNAFSLAVGLPLQIYVSRVLGPGGVGVYGLLEAVVATAAALLDIGIGPTAIRFIPGHLQRHEYGSTLGLIRLGGSILLAVGAIAYGIMLLALRWIAAVWPEAASYRTAVVAMGLLIPLGLLTYFLQQCLRGFQQIRPVISGSVVQLTIKAVLTVGAFALGLRLNGYIFALVLGTVCSVLWLLHRLRAIIRKLPRAKASISAFPQWRRYALISFSGSLVGLADIGLDRLLVGGLIGSGAVGVLLIVRQLQGFPERFTQMLLMIGAPLLSAAHGRDDRAERQHVYWLITDWSVRFSLPLVVFLAVFGLPVLSLYGAQFADAGTKFS